MQKFVSGVGLVDMTAAEIAAREAEIANRPPEPLPSLEPWQFFAMLDLSGKRADLEAFIDAMQEPARTVAKAKLERSLVFYRDNDLVLAAQQALGLSTQELDGLWLQAKSL